MEGNHHTRRAGENHGRDIKYRVIEPRETPSPAQPSKGNGKQKESKKSKSTSWWHGPSTSKSKHQTTTAKGQRREPIEIVDPPSTSTRPKKVRFAERERQPYAWAPSPIEPRFVEREPRPRFQHEAQHSDLFKGEDLQTTPAEASSARTNEESMPQPKSKPKLRVQISHQEEKTPAVRRSDLPRSQPHIRIRPLAEINSPLQFHPQQDIRLREVRRPQSTERYQAPPIREHARLVSLHYASPARIRQARAPSPPRVYVREHQARPIVRAPSPQRRNHSTRRLVDVEDRIEELEGKLRLLRQRRSSDRQARLDEILDELDDLYYRQEREERHHRERLQEQEDHARFENERQRRLEADRRRSITITQQSRREPRTVRHDTESFEEQGQRVLDEAVRRRRAEEYEVTGIIRRDHDSRLAPRRRNTVSGSGPSERIWEDDRARIRRRWI
ncbi:hypothetical protein MMC25_001013 [Agyrium rufum]|nr:hypothetical protein [Agyrium rufum]